jgi:hypothetical protein
MTEIEKAFLDTYQKLPTPAELRQYAPYYRMREVAFTTTDYFALVQRKPSDVRWLKEHFAKRRAKQSPAR